MSSALASTARMQSTGCGLLRRGCEGVWLRSGARDGFQQVDPALSGRRKLAGEPGLTWRRLAVRLCVADVWFEAQAAVDASRRVAFLGDDDPSVAAVIGGPSSCNAEEVGGQPATAMLLVGADALIARRRATTDDTQISYELSVVKRAEAGPNFPFGEFTSRPRLASSESLKRPWIMFTGSIVLGHRPSRQQRPVLPAEAAHRIPVGQWLLLGQGACREDVVQFHVESLGDPGLRVVGRPDQSDRDPGRCGKG